MPVGGVTAVTAKPDREQSRVLVRRLLINFKIEIGWLCQGSCRDRGRWSLRRWHTLSRVAVAYKEKKKKSVELALAWDGGLSISPPLAGTRGRKVGQAVRVDVDSPCWFAI